MYIDWLHLANHSVIIKFGTNKTIQNVPPKASFPKGLIPQLVKSKSQVNCYTETDSTLFYLSIT